MGAHFLCFGLGRDYVSTRTCFLLPRYRLPLCIGLGSFLHGMGFREMSIGVLLVNPINRSLMVVGLINIIFVLYLKVFVSRILPEFASNILT